MARRGREKREKKVAWEGPETTAESPCDLDGIGQPPPHGGEGKGRVMAFLHSRYIQVLLAIILLGSFLRLFQLGSASLWLDEASTLTFARRSIPEIWGSLSAGEFNPPLFYWMEHAMLAFGESEAVLRLIPAVLGILTIPVFYLIGSEILDRNTGILAAALLAFSPFAVSYSQEARAYVPMLFFFSLALLFFLRLMRTGDGRDAILFGVFSAAAFWTHFYAFVPVIGLLAFGFAVKGKEMLANVRRGASMSISTLVFVILSLPLIFHAIQLFTLRTGGGPSFGIQGLGTITLTLIQISGYSEILAWIFLALFILGVSSLFLLHREKALLLVFSLAFPLLLSVILSYRMPMVPRYLIYLLPAYLPGIALTIRPACARFGGRKLVYTALALALVVHLPVLSPYYTTLQKDDWRGLSRDLAAMALPGDLVVAIPGYIRQPLDYYYANATDGTREYGVYTVPELENLSRIKGEHRIFYVLTPDILSTDPGGKVVQWLQANTLWNERTQYPQALWLVQSP